MAAKTWILTDQQQQLHEQELVVQPADVGGAASGYKIARRRLRGGLSEGVDTIRVDNGRLSFEVLPTRGMSLWKAWLGDDEFGWKSPVRGPVHPQFVPIGEPGGLGWLDGFDELLVRCGLESNGAPEMDEDGRLRYPLHGRIANKPAHHLELSVDGDQGTITLKGSVEETRFHFLKLRLNSTITTRLGEPTLHLHDEVENLSASPAEMQLLYHINFGLPLLDAGARLVAPVKSLVPRNERAASGTANWDSYAAEEPGFEEQVYFMELQADQQGGTQTLLKNAHSTRGVSLLFNKKQLPCFTMWKNTTSAADGYVTGLEPGTNFPNPRSYEGEQGRVVKLAGGGRFSFDLTLQFHQQAGQVEQAEQAIAQLQSAPPKIYSEPQKGWCAP